MSYAIKASKSQYRGDPGIFGFLGKAVSTIGKGLVGAATGFATGGPAGAILGAARTVLPGKTSAPQVFMAQSPSPGTVLTASNMPSLPALPGIGLPTGITSRGVSVGTFGQNPMQISPGTPATTGALVGTPGAGMPACTRGYHYNRTGYFTKKYGWIERGTVCVKNRRRNPLNPRALSRSMARLESAKKATEALKRVSIRPSRGCGCR